MKRKPKKYINHENDGIKVIGYDPAHQRTPHSNKGSYVIKCKHCDRVAYVSGGNVARMNSCGCKQKLPPGEGSFRWLFLSYRHHAKQREIPWSLTRDEFKDVITKDCHYCGLPPSLITSKVVCNGKFKYNGVDRVDSAGGYDFKNCVPSCKTCNFAKGTLSQEAFYAWLKKAYEFSLTKVPSLL